MIASIPSLLLLICSLLAIANAALPTPRVQRAPSRNVAKGLAAHNASHEKHSHGQHRRGLQCYTGSDFAIGELADCEGKGAHCFMRYYGSAEGVQMNRYCSTKETCNPAGFTEYTADGKTYVAKCCDSTGCNSGIPAQLADGLYWVRPADDDQQFVTRSEDGSFSMAEFANDVTQKFELQSLGSSLEAKFALLAPGTALEGAKAWIVLEVGPGEFSIKAVEDSMSLAGGPDAKFTLTRTPHWDVAWVGKTCPKSVKVGDVTSVDQCQEACEQDPTCTDIFEWDSKKGECFKVTGKCGKDDTEAGSDGYFSFKSKCAFVKCQAESQCHAAGTCDATTGACTNPELDAGALCDDGNHLTVDDACAAGVCVGVNKCAGVSCPADGACYDEGTCNPHTGKCVAKEAAGGTACDDEDEATIDDMCNGGVCKGTDLCAGVKCETQECHFSGTCQAKTGRCSIRAKNKGARCDDGSKLTKDDTCDENGVCQGVGKCDKIKCRAQGPCFTKGECDAETGRCSNPAAEQGTKCDDESSVTIDDVCDGHGVCSGTNKCEGVTCAADEGPCKRAGACDHNTGSCLVVNKDDGAHCDDGDAATADDACYAGECKGTELCAHVSCAALNGCHTAGECDPATGSCSNPQADDDSSCDDGNDFTFDDKCKAGRCVGTKGNGQQLLAIKKAAAKKASFIGLRGAP